MKDAAAHDASVKQLLRQLLAGVRRTSSARDLTRIVASENFLAAVAALDDARRLLVLERYARQWTIAALRDWQGEHALQGQGVNKRGRAYQRKHRTVRYINPDNPGQTWGGRGRPPAWYQKGMERVS